MLAREAYEGANGWADGRLGQAYDLIHSMRSDYTDWPHLDFVLRHLLGGIEDADFEIGAGS